MAINSTNFDRSTVLLEWFARYSEALKSLTCTGEMLEGFQQRVLRCEKANYATDFYRALACMIYVCW